MFEAVRPHQQRKSRRKNELNIIIYIEPRLESPTNEEEKTVRITSESRLVDNEITDFEGVESTEADIKIQSFSGME